MRLLRVVLVAAAATLSCQSTSRTIIAGDAQPGGGADTGRGGSAGTSSGGSAGAAVTGGSAGAGGGDGLGLGQPCSSAVSCASGFCADGACCDAACNGLCEQCSSAGACTATADDTACETISCPVDTLCADYQASITTNRCAARGACKTATDCTFTATAVRTPCGSASDSYICDGAGACVLPKVKCSGELCTANYATSGATGCCSNTSCTSTCSGNRIFCDEGADCALGMICCNVMPLNPSTAYCRPAADCVNGAYVSVEQVCNPSSNECPASKSCLPKGTSSTLPAGYYTCQ